MEVHPYLEILTYEPLIDTMSHPSKGFPNFSSNQIMEELISIKKVNGKSLDQLFKFLPTPFQVLCKGPGQMLDPSLVYASIVINIS